MATKPSSLPRWATAQTDPEADLTEPSAGTKDQGYLNATKPRAGYMNWWKNLTYTWCAYLDDLEAQAFDWVGLHTFAQDTEFAQDVTVGGDALIAGDALVTGDVEAATLTTAQTSVQRAQGWHPVPMCAFNIDAELANMEYDPVTDTIQASAGVPALTRLACAPLSFLVTGDRIRDIKLTATPVDGTPSSCDLWLCRKLASTGVVTKLVLATVTTTATRDTVVSADIAHVVDADLYTYFLAIEMADNTNTGVFEAAGVRTDRVN